MEYHQIYCNTCQDTFKPLVATSPSELLHPDYDECERVAGVCNAESLQAFHHIHQGPGHELKTRTVEGDPVPAWYADKVNS